MYNEASNTANTALPNALTGIIDENGNRYATFKYNAQGWAISTEHSTGIDKYTLSYTSLYSSTQVTDPRGALRTFTFTKVLGVFKNLQVYQASVTASGSVFRDISYDANGNVSAYTDFNGIKTSYTYDLTRNLELTRIEAAGTSSARTTSTQWHPALRLPLKIAEPKRLTTFGYDASGNLLSKTVQATADTSGALGANATAVGNARIWTYTYNQLGQMLSEKGPRTDVNDVTSYAYDDAGNLSSITNALGHVTVYGDYDPNGRVGTVTSPSGLVTRFSYAPRGWLLSRTVGGEVTGFDYDGVGQLTQVTLPDNSTIRYAYDEAHRLTGITDSLGNSIAYVLDVMGNRISEHVNDPGGNLSANITRAYSGMNQLKQQTGVRQ